MNKLAISIVLVLLFAPACGALAGKLGIGMKPPPMKVSKWLEGKPITRFEKGMIYVVDFWATWCPPCRASIPHLTELAKKYKNVVSFVGVNVWDNEEDGSLKAYTARVSKFVSAQGDKMAYNVALDTMASTMSETWLWPAGVDGIPVAFVIDKGGKIAAIVHPMELEDILPKVISGKFDSKAFRKKQQQEEARRDKEEAALVAREKTIESAASKLAALAKEGKNRELVDEFDKMAASDPQLEANLGIMKVSALMLFDEPQAYFYARKLADTYYKDEYMYLFLIAYMIIDNPKLESPDYSLALCLAERANEITRGEAPYPLYVLALTHFKMGHKDKGLEYQGMLKKHDARLNADARRGMYDRLAELANQNTTK